MTRSLSDRIDSVEARHELPDGLLAAIVKTESGGDPRAARVERFYRWIVPFAAHGGTVETEVEMQKISYGLGQIMGATARERGLDGPWLSDLFDPDLNLEFTARHLSWLLNRYDGNVHDAIAAYNQGNRRRNVQGQYCNQGYVDKVLLAYGDVAGTRRSIDECFQGSG